MNAFNPAGDLGQDLGFGLLVNTAVSLFYRRQVLDETCARLAEQGYQVTALNASAWSEEADMHQAIAAAFEFPSYYGRNLNALNDCLRDVITHEYGWDASTTGLALVLVGYDAFASACPRQAQVLLNIVADRSRETSLYGGRMMCLVQSDNPRLQFDPVGATPVLWNNAEWLNSTWLDS